jgi:hypothetical protein
MSNPGGIFEFRFLENIYLAWLIPWGTLILVGFALVVAIFVYYQWRQKPRFLRYAFLCVLPPIFVLYLLFGGLYEIRVFYEAYSITFLLFIEGIALLLGIRLDALSRTNTV